MAQTPPLTLWRIYDHRPEWARAKGFDPLDGAGGLYSGSRWNSKGTRAVYLGSSAALAILETVVHVGSRRFGTRTLLRAEAMSDSVEEVSLEFFHQLQHNATDLRREGLTRQFGDGWAAEGRTLLLRVPSAVIPFDFNYVFNPLHPEAERVRVVERTLITLDARLLDDQP